MSEHLALLGGTPVSNNLYEPYAIVGEEEVSAIIRVIKRRQLSMFGTTEATASGGREIVAFEDEFSRHYGFKHSIALNSATSGLHAALAACDVGPGDEVIVPSYSFTATATCVLMHNAIPVFADVELDDYAISARTIAPLITDRTKAVIVVHLFGMPAEMDEIVCLCRSRDIALIEDCAQAQGARYKGRFVGGIGDMGVFSFQETKNMCTGEGGMVVSNAGQFIEKAKLIRNHGEELLYGKPREYLSNVVGWNYRMTEITAAIAREQLKKINGFNDRRRTNIDYILNNIKLHDGFSIQKQKVHCESANEIFAIRLDKDIMGISRNTFIIAMKKEGVSVDGGYPRPLYKNPVFQDQMAYGKSGCPFTCSYYGKSINYRNIVNINSEKLCNEIIRYFYLRPQDGKEVIHFVTAFNKVINNLDQLIIYEKQYLK